MQDTTWRVRKERSQDIQDIPSSAHPLKKESEGNLKEENNGSSRKDNDDYENSQETPQEKEDKTKTRGKDLTKDMEDYHIPSPSSFQLEVYETCIQRKANCSRKEEDN